MQHKWDKLKVESLDMRGLTEGEIKERLKFLPLTVRLNILLKSFLEIAVEVEKNKAEKQLEALRKIKEHYASE